MPTLMTRCFWAGSDPLYIAYHDTEWGVPLHDDRALFELLTLEGAQAGLSWLTILKKRAAYVQAFDHFDAETIACYDEAKIAELLLNDGIVRNRLKVQSTVTNARALLKLKQHFTSFNEYLWRFVDGAPKHNNWQGKEDVPARSVESDALSRDLIQREFKFVGSTICYAFMQASGMVNDHMVSCFRHRQVTQLGSDTFKSIVNKKKRA